ncbi:MAG: ABC transporter ATP-binding protein [Candidatus Thiodiazotropha sp. (ex Epidulcina cf. delphinae)]|nr:ABC transporter ATP-binding protein [Candidatus Thiodiazotropha sp. (ex Epidulcina cf. delphinae)]
MIKLCAIDFNYAKQPLLFNELSLEITKGSLFGLLGPNGAGKTTLMSLMTGLLTPSQGEVAIDGKGYRNHRFDILSGLAHIPQEYAFYPQLSAAENLQFFSSLYPGTMSQRRRRIEHAIELTGLTGHVKRLAKHFSGGLKRRLNLAIGLLNKPELIFLDEPTVGIDPQSRRFILQSIQALNRAGSTIVYTSHYMEEIEQLCNDVAIMDHGRILVHGPLNRILEKRPMVEIDLDPQQQPLAGTPFNQAIEEMGFTLSHHRITGKPRDQKQIAELLTAVSREGIPILNISYGKHTLEKLFFELTNTHLRD